MASLLSLTTHPPSTTLPFPSSSFKGTLTNLTSLTSNPYNLSSLKLNLPTFTNSTKNPLSVFAVSTIVSESLPARVPATRLRLDNLGPQPGSRKKAKRKGRGHGAGQGGSCGFGMRGQKSRSGPGVMRGFEGGQMPLYRRIPKLRGIAGGMSAGLPKYVPVNLRDIEVAGFKDGEEVSLESLKDKGIINPSGRDRRLPLKIKDQRYIILYGGNDIDWIQRFTRQAQSVASDLQAHIEMVYMGNKQNKDLSRRVKDVILIEKLSHCLPESSMTYFWT